MLGLCTRLRTQPPGVTIAAGRRSCSALQVNPLQLTTHQLVHLNTKILGDTALRLDKTILCPQRSDGTRRSCAAAVRQNTVIMRLATIHLDQGFALAAAIQRGGTIARSSAVEPGTVLFPVGISFHRWPRASPGGNAIQRLATASTAQLRLCTTAVPLRNGVVRGFTRCLRHCS